MAWDNAAFSTLGTGSVQPSSDMPTSSAAPTRAFTLAPVSVIGPFDYTAMLWAVAIEALILGILPTGTVVLGSAIVIASGLYILYREARVAK